MDAKMSSHVLHVIQQFVQSAMHGICNVKIVEQKLELAHLQRNPQCVNVKLAKMELENVLIKNHAVTLGMFYVRWEENVPNQSLQRSVHFLILDAKVVNGGINTDYGLCLLEESLD